MKDTHICTIIVTYEYSYTHDATHTSWNELGLSVIDNIIYHFIHTDATIVNISHSVACLPDTHKNENYIALSISAIILYTGILIADLALFIQKGLSLARIDDAYIFLVSDTVVGITFK